MRVWIIGNVAGPEGERVGCLRVNGDVLTPNRGSRRTGGIGYEEISGRRIRMVIAHEIAMKQCGIVANGVIVFRAKGAYERKKSNVIERRGESLIAAFEITVNDAIILLHTSRALAIYRRDTKPG